MKFKLLFILLFLNWHTLSAQNSLDSLRLVVPVGHNSVVESAFFNNKSNFIISFSRDNSAVLYSVHSGKEVLRFNSTSNKKYVNASFSNNSRYLALVNTQGIELIDLETGLISNVYSNKNITASCVKFIDNDQKLIFGLQDSTINILSLFKREIVKSTKLNGVVAKMEINQMGDKIILRYDGFFGDKSNLFSILSVSNFFIDSIVLPENATCLDVQFIKKQNRIYYSYYNTIIGKSFVKIYDFKRRSIVLGREFDIEVVKTQLNNTRDLFLMVGSDNSVWIYKFNSFELIKQVIKHDYFISDAKLSSDGKYIASCTFDGKLNIVNLSDSSLNMSINQNYKLLFVNFDVSGKKLIVGGYGKLLSFYDLEKKINFQFKGFALKPTSAELSSNGNFFLCTYDDYSVKEITISNPQNQNIFLFHNAFSISKYCFDNRLIVTASDDSTCVVYDVIKKKTVFESNKHGNALNSASLSFGSNFIASTTGNIGDINSEKAVRVIDISSGETVNYFRTKGIVKSANFSCDDVDLIVSTGIKTILYNLNNKSVTKSFTNNKSGVINSEFGEGCQVIFVSCEDGSMYLLNRDNFSVLDSLKIYDLGRISAHFDKSKNYIIVTSQFKIRIFLINEENKFQEIFVLESDIELYDVDLFGSTLLITTINYKTSLINMENKTLIYERIQLENNNWLVKLPNSPYYMCSKDASKMLHYVTPSLRVIGFEQLDPVYNRPDIVLDSIGKYFGGADQELVANYRQSWEKRIDRLGLDKDKLGKGEISVPNAEIVGADEIAYENKEGKLEINVSANDPKYPLRRFNVYVNEVPLYGSAGISIAHLKKQVWDTTVSVPLSMGENKIQVSVMNELGLENFKYPTYVNYSPQNELVAKTFFIGIGVNEFMEQEHNLKYCVKDVQDLAKAFAEANSNVDTLLLTNKEVTRENILKLKELLSKTSVNDKVIISCSSHGLLDDSLNFYLAMHDVDFNNPQVRGLKYEELESLLDGIPARQKLLLLDACNSGENDKTEVLKKELEQKQVKMKTDEVLAARGAIVELKEENKSNFQKMNELFVNVRNNTGSVIISAAGGQEFALEAIEVDGKTIENGAFTYSVLEYLNSNKANSEALTVNKLKQYAEKRVDEITNGKQKPTSRQETMEVDWRLR